MIKIALWIFLILSANMMMPSSIIEIDLRDGREILNGLGILLLLIIYLVRQGAQQSIPNSWDSLKHTRPKLPAILGIFWGWAVVMSLARYNSLYSYVTLANISLYMLLFWVIMQVIQEEEDITCTLNVICIGALIQIAWCAAQKFGIDLSISIGRVKYLYTAGPGVASAIAGTIGSNNGLSPYLAISFPAFLRNTAIFKWRKLNWLKWWYLTPLILWPFWQISTRGGFVALIAGLIFLLTFMKMNWKIKTIAFLIVISVFSFYMHNKASESWKGIVTNLRWKNYKLAYYLAEHTTIRHNKIYITETPNTKESIMGQGLGQFRALYRVTAEAHLTTNKEDLTNDPAKRLPLPKWYIPNMAQLHNDPWQAKYEMGDIGFALVYIFIIMLGVIFARLKKTHTALLISSGVLIIIINSHVNFLFHTPGLAPLAIIYLAIFVKLPRSNYKGVDIL